MKYEQQFKERCFKVLRFCPEVEITKLMSALDSGNDTLVRYALENALDDKELYEKEKLTDEGDRIVNNSKLFAYTDRVELYSDFMDALIHELDGEPTKVGLLQQR